MSPSCISLKTKKSFALFDVQGQRGTKEDATPGSRERFEAPRQRHFNKFAFFEGGALLVDDVPALVAARGGWLGLLAHILAPTFPLLNSNPSPILFIYAR